MAVSPRIKQIARQLVELSLENDRVSADRVSQVLQSLAAHPPRQYRAVLLAYRNGLRRELERSQAQVEYAGPFEATDEAALAAHFTALCGRPIEVVAQPNPSLLAGLRVRVADNVYETSLRQRLNLLARSV